MAYLSLTDTEQRTAFFRASALRNLHYWQARLTTNTDLLPPEEHNNLLRAVKMALPLDEAWPLLYDIVTGVSPLLERRGRWEAGHWAISHALEAARRRHDSAAEVTLSALTARLLFQQSRYPESVRAYRRVIRLARSIGDRFNEARACTNLGFHFAERGCWQRAEVLCCHALQLFEKLNSAHGRAHTENHLGFLYTRQHQWEKAQYHLERACNIWQTMGDEHGLMRGYLNSGGLYNDAGQPDLALYYLKKALQLALQTGENIAIGRVYINIGKAYRLAKNFDKAEVCVRQAQDIFQQYSNLSELTRAWSELGVLYCQQERWPEAS
ncbi:MAG: tetratricopeptide repeat protein, partial [Anaerolineae bacterium]|nr:tetratricopeptide repeat protein [Anaerolineae bacterium]